jgi:HlyD family type I secretion membrane fusion protein
MAKRSKARDTSADLNLDLGKERGLGIKSRVFAGSLAALMLVFGFGGWAATSELSGAVIGQGQVMVDKDLRAIQHLDGGIIRSIAVKKGEVISEGQVMFTLDDTQLKSEGQILHDQLLELLAKRQRLIAERDGQTEMVPGDNSLGLDIASSAVYVGELRLFKGNRDNRESQVAQLKQGLAQSDEEIKGLNAQAKSNVKELELVQAEATKVEGLQRKGLIEGSRVYSSARDLNKLKGEREQIVSSIARSKSKRNEVELQILSIEDAARTDAQKQLSDIEPRIAELSARKAANADRLTRMEIRAPIAGTVNEVTVNTIGGVITPAQKLLTIVPQDAHLQVEVKIQPNDIDQLYVGQKAKLKFTAFSSRNTPEIYGIVAFVSPATSTDQASGHVFYVVQVEVSTGELDKLGGKKLVPGMLVETFIQTESRTALSYLVKPFSDQISRAFRER